MISAPPPSPAITSEDPGTTTVVNNVVGIRNTVPRMAHDDGQMNERTGNLNHKAETAQLLRMNPYPQTTNFPAPMQPVPMPPVTNLMHQPFSYTLGENQEFRFGQNQGSSNQKSGFQVMQNRLLMPQRSGNTNIGSDTLIGYEHIQNQGPSLAKKRKIDGNSQKSDELWRLDVKNVSGEITRLFQSLRNDPHKLHTAKVEIMTLLLRLQKPESSVRDLD